MAFSMEIGIRLMLSLCLLWSDLVDKNEAAPNVIIKLGNFIQSSKMSKQSFLFKLDHFSFNRFVDVTDSVSDEFRI